MISDNEDELFPSSSRLTPLSISENTSVFFNEAAVRSRSLSIDAEGLKIPNMTDRGFTDDPLRFTTP